MLVRLNIRSIITNNFKKELKMNLKKNRLVFATIASFAFTFVHAQCNDLAVPGAEVINWENCDKNGEIFKDSYNWLNGANLTNTYNIIS